MKTRFKKIVSISFALVLALLIATPSLAATVTPYSNDSGGAGGTSKGQIASYQVTLTGQSVVDMRMDVNTAIQYANKVTQSNAEQTAFFASALLLSKYSPTTSAYLSWVGYTTSVQRGSVQSKIRALTDKGQKVKVSTYVSSVMGKAVISYTVTSWDGKFQNYGAVSGIRNLNVTYY